jgi:hypothetical protein
VSEYASWEFSEGEEMHPGAGESVKTDDTSANGHSTHGTTNDNDTNTNTQGRKS